MAENVWWVKDGKLGIASYDGGTLTSIDIASKPVRVHFIKRPTKFTSSDLTKKQTPRFLIDTPAIFFLGMISNC